MNNSTPQTTEIRKRPIQKVMTAVEWEAEAVDFMPAELDKMFAADILTFAKQAQDFIFKTMAQMELRPRRSFIRGLKKGKK